MQEERGFFKFLNFRHRKIIHFSLILCLLLIQLLIGGYFYNEFISNKKLAAIEQKLKEMHSLEKLTDASKDQLISAQQYLQNYLITKDKSQLTDYFNILNSIGKNLEILENNGHRYPEIGLAVSAEKEANVVEVKNLKKIIDSAYQTAENIKKPIPDTSFPVFTKFHKGYYDFEKFDVETKTIADTIKKKGLFGRLGDAIKGKDNVQKVTTITTLKPGVPNSVMLQKSFDSIISAANSHYSNEIKKIHIEVREKQVKTEKDKNQNLPEIFSNLLIYNNGLMRVYENAISDSKADLQREYDAQNSKSNKNRIYLVTSAMILMFIVSVLILLLTRLAFVYEQRLNRANRQIKQNLNFKNRILGMLSHEIRSPLKMVDLFIGRINKKVDDEDVKEYLKSISFTNNSLLIQANQILEYTKNQQIENKLVPVKFNLSKEINSILKAIEPYIETRHNRFKVTHDIDPEIEIFSDNAKIHQLYLNILGNANKFTENGTISVSARAKPQGDIVALTTEVCDTGAGISQSDLEKVFDPYFQGVLSGDVENLGAGLGLSLCKEIIEMYSGDISVASEKNVGTTVRFTINLKKVNERNGSEN